MATNYTAENMADLLRTGDDPPQLLEAVMFGAYLDAKGWRMVLGPDGQFRAFRRGLQMTERERLAALYDCFVTEGMF